MPNRYLANEELFSGPSIAEWLTSLRNRPSTAQAVRSIDQDNGLGSTASALREVSLASINNLLSTGDIPRWYGRLQIRRQQPGANQIIFPTLYTHEPTRDFPLPWLSVPDRTSQLAQVLCVRSGRPKVVASSISWRDAMNIVRVYMGGNSVNTMQAAEQFIPKLLAALAAAETSVRTVMLDYLGTRGFFQQHNVPFRSLLTAADITRVRQSLTQAGILYFGTDTNNPSDVEPEPDINDYNDDYQGDDE